jgi:hypothetical protein
MMVILGASRVAINFQTTLEHHVTLWNWKLFSNWLTKPFFFHIFIWVLWACRKGKPIPEQKLNSDTYITLLLELSEENPNNKILRNGFRKVKGPKRT